MCCTAERRSSPRIPIETPVRVARGGEVLLGQAVDISDGGVGLCLPCTLDEGTAVSLTWSWRNHELSADGVVREIHPGSTGVEFRQVSPQAQRAITQLVDQRLISWG